MTGDADRAFLRKAWQQARDGIAEGGRPIGSVLVEDGRVIAAGRNRANQTGDMTSHAEMDCLRAAGPAAGRPGQTLYTTMAPCPMCAGAIVQLGIRRCVVGDAQSYAGHLGFMRENGVEVVVLNDPDCLALVEQGG